MFTASENGRYLFKMIPEDRASKEGNRTKTAKDFGVAYRVDANGEITELWKVSGWFSFQVFLSDDGEYLVRMGPWNFGHEPKVGDLAVAFYKKGHLLKEYSTSDLIEDKSAVITSVTHYEWLANIDSALMLDQNNVFMIRTIDNIQYEFDVTTGSIKSKKKANKSDSNTGTGADDKRKPRHVYHLDQYQQLSVPDGDSRLSYASGKPRGGGYNTYFTVHDIETKALIASPAWTPYGNEPIPLGVSKVAKIARAYWEKHLEAYGKFKISSIELCSPRNYNGNDPSRWFYQVSFDMSLNPIIVLLDETVVPATIIDLEQQK